MNYFKQAVPPRTPTNLGIVSRALQMAIRLSSFFLMSKCVATKAIFAVITTLNSKIQIAGFFAGRLTLFRSVIPFHVHVLFQLSWSSSVTITAKIQRSLKTKRKNYIIQWSGFMILMQWPLFFSDNFLAIVVVACKRFFPVQIRSQSIFSSYGVQPISTRGSSSTEDNE